MAGQGYNFSGAKAKELKAKLKALQKLNAKKGLKT
jgi:hypothetical protein